MDTSYLIKSIATSGIIIGCITFLAKRLIDKSLDAGIERYKSSLQQDLELYKNNLIQQNEILKTELHKTSLEHQIKYSKLYEERGEIIKQTYSQIINIENELINLTSSWQGPEWINTDNNNTIKTSIFQFEKAFEHKRLFFEKILCDDIESLIQKMNDINQRMYSAKTKSQANQELQTNDNYIPLEEFLKPKADWKGLEKEVLFEIKNVRRELERNFAKLIGVE